MCAAAVRPRVRCCRKEHISIIDAAVQKVAAAAADVCAFVCASVNQLTECEPVRGSRRVALLVFELAQPRLDGHELRPRHTV